MLHYTLLLGHETCWHVDAPVLCKQDSSLNKLIAGKRRRKKNGVGVMISLLGSRCFLSLPLHCHNCFQLDSSDLHTHQGKIDGAGERRWEASGRSSLPRWAVITTWWRIYFWPGDPLGCSATVFWCAQPQWPSCLLSCRLLVCQPS
jgi:hypothetical protein